MISVFISYAHADEKLKDRFLVHLGALKRERLIGVWHDRMLRPGEHLNRAIEVELAAADLVILLVSPDFINSDYCTEKEMQRAFARAKAGRCKVVPVILKASLWRDIPIDDEGGRLGDFVALPHDGKPVVRSPHGRETALDIVVAGIRRLIKDKSASGPVVRPQQRDDSSPPTDVRPRKRDDSPPRTYAPTVTVTFTRDVLLADAMVKVFRALLQAKGYDPLPLNEIHLVQAKFRQAALDGRLPIWAKRSSSSSDVWEVVPKEFWNDYYISFSAMMSPHADPTKLSATKIGSFDKRSREWREFMTSSSAVDALWPAKNK